MNKKAFMLYILFNLFIVPLGFAEVGQENIINQTTDLKLEEKIEEKPLYVYVSGHQNSFSYYIQAETLYYEALNSIDRDTRKKKLAMAIGCINRAILEDSNSICSKFLASNIYRAYGVDSYARSYYEKAINACLDCLERNPNNARAQLDLAIMYYSGDSKFYIDYETYKQKALKHANEFLRLGNIETAKEKLNYIDLASTYFILGDDIKAKEALKAYLLEEDKYDKNIYSVCKEMTDGFFTVYPCKGKDNKREFLSYLFVKRY